MKLGTFFIINTVVAIFFGLGLIFMPAKIGEIYGLDATPTSLYISQLLGAAFMAIGLVTFLSRNAGTDLVRPICISFFIGDAIGLIVVAISVMNGVSNSVGWFSVALYGILGAGFAYYGFGNKPST